MKPYEYIFILEKSNSEYIFFINFCLISGLDMIINKLINKLASNTFNYNRSSLE